MSPLAVFNRCHHALLLLHHPPAWLSRQARRTFDEAIYPPDRFALCLHGHMHAGRSETVTISGGRLRYYFQAPSLFGLEHYGTVQEERAVGYAWGSLAADGTVRVWPLRRITRGGGEAVFELDQSFGGDTPVAPAEGIRIRPLSLAEGAPRAAAMDLTPWLEALLARTDHIKISGIGSGVGRVRSANRYPIERLYTALRSHAAVDANRVGPGLERGSVSLAELLPCHQRLLIEGQPGAGKTTFLRFVTAMLARDLLRIPCPGGGTWPSRHLGFDPGQKLRTPVLLRLAELVEALTQDPSRTRDSRERLLTLIEPPPGVDHDMEAWRGHWRRMLEGGAVVLLLDGLDEVAEEGLRERVFEIFRDACRHWDKCPIVVASRPLQTDALREMGFHLATVEPFGRSEVQTFLQRWVAALHELDADAVPPAGVAAYGERLLSAILDRPGIRRLATNPVMLTCLCVVHWNEGELPEGRARVYRAVLRWLVAARSALRARAGFTDRFAERALARLALAMMGTEKGKRVIFDLHEAVEAVDPVVVREFPDLCPEDRRHRARAWLRFECLGSNVVEEVAAQRLRFWHLTFQEYLAAAQLAWLGEGEDPEEDWWPIVQRQLDAAQWRETIDLLPGCLFDEGGEVRVDRLLRRVLGLRAEPPDLPSDAWVAGIIGRLIAPLGAYQYRLPPDIAATYRAVLDRALGIFTLEGAARVPVATRIQAAEALGRSGDPRLGHWQANLLEVPGLNGLRLAKYPVTVEEFRAFVDHGGYDEPRYWDESGWRLRNDENWMAPGGWDDQLLAPNRPVVNVSWHEASAYCAWLSEQREETIRLPTEAEWERAATPRRGKYPWGTKQPDRERANFGVNVAAPTPVGIYPTGNGPYGHCDLAGNVWEWCADDRGKGTAALRGGAWFDPADYLLAAGRRRSGARVRDGFIGFRVAVVPASS